MGGLVNIISQMANRRGVTVTPSSSPFFLTGSFLSFQNNLSWNIPVTGSTYILQRATGSNYSDAVIVYQNSASSFTDSAQLNNTYYYRVTNLSGSVSGSWTNYTINTLPADGTVGTASHFFGDSITVGVGASVQANRWSSVLCASRSWAENNHGVSGTTVTSQSCLGSLVLTNIPTKTTSMNYLFISFGVNDCFLNPGPSATGSVTSASYQSSLTTAISYSINTAGWPANRIIVNTLFFTTFNGNSPSYCSASFQTDEVRKRQFLNCALSASLPFGVNCIDIFNPMSSSVGAGGLADQIHPNDTGHAFIGNYEYTLINH